MLTKLARYRQRYGAQLILRLQCQKVRAFLVEIGDGEGYPRHLLQVVDHARRKILIGLDQCRIAAKSSGISDVRVDRAFCSCAISLH